MLLSVHSVYTVSATHRPRMVCHLCESEILESLTWLCLCQPLAFPGDFTHSLHVHSGISCIVPMDVTQVHIGWQAFHTCSEPQSELHRVKVLKLPEPREGLHFCHHALHMPLWRGSLAQTGLLLPCWVWAHSACGLAKPYEENALDYTVRNQIKPHFFSVFLHQK